MALADAVASAVAAWTLDEASGTRADSVGSNDLTDNNTVGSAAGQFDTAADFETDNSEYLNIADNADLSTGDIDFEIRCWVKFETKAANMAIVTKREALEYQLWYSSGNDRIRFVWGQNAVEATAENFGSPSTGVWYLIHAWHDATNNVVGIAVNAGTANTVADTGANAVDGNGTFNIGRDPAFGMYWDGLIDDVVILKGYILDATERSEDYNGGTGVAFADWDAGGGATTKFRGLTLLGVGC